MKNTGTYSFPRYLFAPWVKTRVSVEEEEVTLHRTETTLGILPCGSEEDVLPIENGIPMIFARIVCFVC